MKLVLSGVLEMKPWGDDEELFLGASTPLVPLIAMNVKEAGSIRSALIEMADERRVYSQGAGECHMTKYHDTNRSGTQRVIEFQVGGFNVYAYMCRHVGEWCQLTVEMGGG